MLSLIRRYVDIASPALVVFDNTLRSCTFTDLTLFCNLQLHKGSDKWFACLMLSEYSVVKLVGGTSSCSASWNIKRLQLCYTALTANSCSAVFVLQMTHMFANQECTN